MHYPVADLHTKYPVVCSALSTGLWSCGHLASKTRLFLEAFYLFDTSLLDISFILVIMLALRSTVTSRELSVFHYCRLYTDLGLRQSCIDGIIFDHLSSSQCGYIILSSPVIPLYVYQ